LSRPPEPKPEVPNIPKILRRFGPRSVGVPSKMKVVELWSFLRLWQLQNYLQPSVYEEIEVHIRNANRAIAAAFLIRPLKVLLKIFMAPSITLASLNQTGLSTSQPKTGGTFWDMLDAVVNTMVAGCRLIPPRQPGAVLLRSL